MSYFDLQFVPTDPSFCPKHEAAQAAEAMLMSIMTDAEEVMADIYPGIQFIDSGECWSEPMCSACGADTKSWWSDAATAAWDVDRFANLLVTAKCCGARVLLNDLLYPGGDRFASFLLTTNHADPAQEVSFAQQQALEAILGCPLTKSWVHR